MRLPHPFGSPLPGSSFHWLLWSDALTLLSMMVGQVALPWWIAQSGGAHDLSAAVRRAAGDAAYVRVTTGRFREAAGAGTPAR